MHTDPRIEVWLDPPDGGPGWAWLVELGTQAPPGPAESFLPALHPQGCGCCPPRNQAATALSRLFLRRARGEVPPFGHVGVCTRTPQGKQAVLAALGGDVFCCARFRQGQGLCPRTPTGAVGPRPLY